MKKKITAVILTGGLIFGTVPAGGVLIHAGELDPYALYKYSITEEGTIPDQRYSFMRDSLLTSDGEHYVFNNSKGEAVIDSIADVDYLGDDLYAVRQEMTMEDVNRTGLYTGEGEELIPCEAASIVRPHNRDRDFHFLEVIYTTEQTDDESEAIIYFTQSMFSLHVGEDDVMYKGYAKIYDLDNRKFVDNFEAVRLDRYSFYDLGESFLIDYSNGGKVYNTAGEVLFEAEGFQNFDPTYHAFIARDADGNSGIYNAKGELTCLPDSEMRVSISNLQEEYDTFIAYIDDSYQALGMDGNPVLPGTWPLLYRQCGRYFQTRDEENDQYYIIDEEGNTVTENASMYCTLNGYGFIESDEEGSEEVTLITPNGLTEGLTEESTSNLVFSKEGKGVILNTGEAAIEVSEEERISYVAPALISSDLTAEDGHIIKIYDLFTGAVLLEGDWDQVNTAGERIYLRKADGSGWDVYRFELTIL